MNILRYISIFISLCISILVILNFVSYHIYSDLNPKAFALNPFNMEKRISFLSDQLSKSDLPKERLLALEEIASQGTRLEPNEAKLFGLVGAFKDAAGDVEAQKYYQKALLRSPADQLSLVNRYAFLINEGRLSEAVPIAELLYVRWPNSFESLSPFLSRLLKDPDNYNEMLARFSKRNKGILTLMSSVIKHDNDLALAYRIALDSNQKFATDARALLPALLDRLFQQQQYSKAYFLFYKTLSDENKNKLGYIFNHDFSGEPLGNYFDWTLTQQAGVWIKQHQPLPTSNENTYGNGGIEIKFLNQPVMFTNIAQTLYLPKTKLNLSIRYSVKDFKGPKPITAKLFCLYPTSSITELDLSKDNVNNQLIEAEFEVPANGCEIQRILFTNNNTVESWKNRYSGKLTLHEVKISASKT